MKMTFEKLVMLFKVLNRIQARNNIKVTATRRNPPETFSFLLPDTTDHENTVEQYLTQKAGLCQNHPLLRNNKRILIDYY